MFLDLLELYKHHNMQEKSLSNIMNKIDVHLSHEYPDINMNFNTLYVLDHNNMNNKQNTELLYLSKNIKDWFESCYAI